MSKVNVIFGTHNGLPLGSPDSNFEALYQKAYKPFLTLLNNFPEIPAVLHYSGIVLEWLEVHHPEFLMLLNDLVKRKQIEILGGGYYHPVFTLIPNSDRLGQIEYLTTYLRKRFNKRPRGCWITERVWEPSLSSNIKSSGMDYIFLDDRHFITAGLEGTDLYSPCITEDQGKTLMVYPITTEFRYSIPYESPRSVVDKILKIGELGSNLVVSLMADGAKYGFWEETYQICYEKEWLKTFITLLLEHKDRIRVILPETLQRLPIPRKKVYFHCSSYEEMMSWMLTVNQHADFKSVKESVAHKRHSAYVHGGFFRQFLSKYPESNLLYAKMMYVSVLVNQIRGDKYRKKAAKEDLWKGQNHSVYWHGDSGWIYHNSIRKSGYKALLDAEKITRQQGIFIPSVITTDFDMDGENEFLYQGHELNAYVHLAGGMLFELDYLPISWNYLDTMARHNEPEKQAKSQLPSDTTMRKAFMDHFFLTEETLDNFDNRSYLEGGDFIRKRYLVKKVNRESKEIVLEAYGFIRDNHLDYPLHIEKSYKFNQSYFSVHYLLRNIGTETINTFFAPEINLSFLSDELEKLRIYGENRKEELGPGKQVVNEISEVRAHDLHNKVIVSLSSSQVFNLWVLPIRTRVKKRNSWENLYQSTCFVPQWKVSLISEGAWEVSLVVNFTKF